MTAKQKAAREKFKKVVADAKKIRKANPKLTQAQAVKKAWAAVKKVGAIKIVEKGESKSAKPKATYQQKRTKKGTYAGLKKVGAVKKKAAKKSTSYHKDTKSHNVNIRVVSGTDIKNLALSKYKETIKEIGYYEDAIKRLKSNILSMTSPEKVRAKIVLKRWSEMLKEMKEHAKQLKKLI